MGIESLRNTVGRSRDGAASKLSYARSLTTLDANGSVMPVPATTRQLVSHRGFFFGVLLLVGLNLAFGPCAWAFADTVDYDCPHCPRLHSPEHAESVAGTHNHDVASFESPCASDAAQCCSVEGIAQDARPSHLRSKDEPSDLPTATLSTAGLISPSAADEPIVAALPLGTRPGARLSLHVLFCVYLD